MRRLVASLTLSVLVLACFSQVSFGAERSDPIGAAPAAPGSNEPLFLGAEIPIPLQEDIRALAPVGPEVVGLNSEADLEAQVVKVVVQAAAEVDDTPHVYTYAVAAGDTLWAIADEHGVKLDTVLGANPDINPNVLRVGQVIKVPSVDGVIHKVASGDTVSTLAAKYKVEATAILDANKIADPNLLTVGQELIIPGAIPVIVHKVTTQTGGTTTLTAKFRWPVSGLISSRFGWRNGRFHRGLDIAAPQGRTIVAARAGQVIYSGWQSGYGNTIMISHGDDLVSLYGHASKLLVNVGEWVEAGTSIALVGSTGNSTGPHCHFEVRVDGTAVNPLELLP